MVKSKLGLLLLGITVPSLLLTGCETINRIGKNYESDWGGGLNRELTVYDADGEVLFEQKGKFDIQESDGGNKVIYDDQDGMRHNIYLGSGTVIVNEVPDGS